MFIRKAMDKDNVVNVHYAALFSHKEEQKFTV